MLPTLTLRGLTDERFGKIRNQALFRISFSINSGKSYILFSVNDTGSVNIDNNDIAFENKNELLGIVLDSKLSFEDHINCLFKKASQKLNALARSVPYICPIKRKSYENIWNIPTWP